jgi:FxsC-like protein
MAQARQELRARPGPRSFFLSYAPPGPFTVSEQPEPDRSVSRFFAALTQAIQDRAGPRADRIRGFYDQEIPPGSDRNESLRQALGEAEVFVPLCSPNYFSRSWPGREWACFEIRLKQARVEDRTARIVPVLWAPIHEPEYKNYIQEALAVGGATPEYEKYGVRELQDLVSYQPAYEAVVRGLAQRIVALAQEPPLAPSAIPDISDVRSAFREPLADFDISVAAPTRNSAAAVHQPGTYADSQTGWRPFPGQQLTLAENARQVVERLDFQVNIIPAGPAGDPARRGPGLLLVDPWVLASQDTADEERAALEAAVHGLPGWVIPLLVLGPSHDWEATHLAQQARDIIDHAEVLPTGSARRPVRSADSLDQFEAIVPRLVAEAERHYLRYGSSFGSGPGASGRPTLSHPPQPGSTPSAPPPAGETLDE